MNRQQAIRQFVERWKERGREKSDTQPFWLSLLRAYGIEEPEDFIKFEGPVYFGTAGRGAFDAAIPATSVLIEQKSRGVDLTKPIRQSNGEMLTPIQQAMKYIPGMPKSTHPTWVITCNFEEFRIYNMEVEHPGTECEVVKLCNLGEEYYRLEFIARGNTDSQKKELEVSVKAGEIVGKLYDAFLSEYRRPNSPATLHSLNVLCVRLVFCLYAEDSGIFEHGQFHDYLRGFSTEQMRDGLLRLFQVLDQKEEDRDPYLGPTLKAFPYVNGGLFQDNSVEVPLFTERIRHLILVEASEQFNWARISPTIFGAVFESTLNPETRRSGGMHYTSVENIHKALDPLFLEELKDELEEILGLENWRVRVRRLKEFQDRLSNLTFLDPACGSGNFLTETYLSLRRLENRALKARLAGVAGQIALGGMLSDEEIGIRVGIGQFYGIEINDFAVSVARTALWIAEHQMMLETSEIVKRDLEFLPLKTDAHIVEGNALRLDWETVCPKTGLSFIVGNPPFSGARLMGPEQKADLQSVFAGWKKTGNLDYVSCWFKKARDYMVGSQVRAALVATNSICQGEQVPLLWKPLMESGLQIDFAWRTFRWDSEATLKAHVHCIIIGFSMVPNQRPRVLYDGGEAVQATNINGYLMDAENVFIESSNTPLCKTAPAARSGNMPIDGGNYLFTPEEKKAFLKKEPKAEGLFHRWYGAEEFIKGKERWCLWLGDTPLAELHRMPACLERMKAVREYRLDSKRDSTVKFADSPTRFYFETFPQSDSLILPLTSSERREYVPIGFLSPDCMASNLVTVVMNAGLYHFGVLTSSVFMSWMRAVCGRLKSDYRITVTNVYNPFPWPEPNGKQKAKIEQTAQAILDARESGISLARLYDPDFMPDSLRKAHKANDRVVLEAYGLRADATEAEIVSHLMGLYQKLTGG